MKHTASAIVALALGLGLAAAAQAQGTTQNAPSANNNMQSAAPSQSMQTPQSAQMQQQPQLKKQRPAKHAMLHRRGISGRNEIRQVQLRLKSEGLFKGKVTGKMDRQTRIALNRFKQQNGLPRNTSLARADRMLSGSSMPQMRTARLHKPQQTRIAHARPQKSQTTGVGSSTPSPSNTPVVNPSSTTPAPAGAGNGSTTPPNNGQSGMNQPNTGGAAKKY